MRAGRPKKTLLALLKSTSFKLGELQQICDWGEVSNTGDKVVLAARIMEGSKNYYINFMTVDLDDLTYLQLLCKCHREDLPSKGELSVLQKTIKHFIGGGAKKTATRQSTRTWHLCSNMG